MNSIQWYANWKNSGLHDPPAMQIVSGNEEFVREFTNGASFVIQPSIVESNSLTDGLNVIDVRVFPLNDLFKDNEDGNENKNSCVGVDNYESFEDVYESLTPKQRELFLFSNKVAFHLGHGL